MPIILALVPLRAAGVVAPRIADVLAVEPRGVELGRGAPAKLVLAHLARHEPGLAPITFGGGGGWRRQDEGRGVAGLAGLAVVHSAVLVPAARFSRRA